MSGTGNDATSRSTPGISSRSSSFPSISINSNGNGNGNVRNTRRVVLVTGAAQGIGRGIALRFAHDNYKVAISDLPGQVEKLKELEVEISRISSGFSRGRESESFIKGVGTEKGQIHNGRGVIVIPADVTKEEDVKTMVERCAEELGGLDVMVSNAGIAIYKPLLELPIEEFDKVIAVNLRGAMLCYKYAAQQMVKQGRGGRIIGASSMYGKSGAPNLAGYSASKFGIRGLTHTAALEWGKYGITVNTYAPAGIRTPMLEEYDALMTSSKEGMKNGDLLQLITNRSALGYLAGPPEVASLVAYLASPEAHFITGPCLLSYVFVTRLIQGKRCPLTAVPSSTSGSVGERSGWTEEIKWRGIN